MGPVHLNINQNCLTLVNKNDSLLAKWSVVEKVTKANLKLKKKFYLNIKKTYRGLR